VGQALVDAPRDGHLVGRVAADDYQAHAELLAAPVEERRRRRVEDVVVRRVRLQQAAPVHARRRDAAHDAHLLDLGREERLVVAEEERGVLERRDDDDADGLRLRGHEDAVEQRPPRLQGEGPLGAVRGHVGERRRVRRLVAARDVAAVGAERDRHGVEADHVHGAPRELRALEGRVEHGDDAQQIYKIELDEVAREDHGHLVVEVRPGVREHDDLLRHDVHARRRHAQLAVEGLVARLQCERREGCHAAAKRRVMRGCPMSRRSPGRDSRPIG